MNKPRQRPFAATAQTHLVNRGNSLIRAGCGFCRRLAALNRGNCRRDTHIFGQYAPFHTKLANATVRDAAHLLDDLLYHESDMRIEEPYTDTRFTVIIR